MADTIITKVIPITNNGDLIYTNIKDIQKEMEGSYKIEKLAVSKDNVVITTNNDKLLIHLFATKTL